MAFDMKAGVVQLASHLGGSKACGGHVDFQKLAGVVALKDLA